uniref:Uncharacterized protein n=1 Tax=Cyanothece sp. (strain PCC 7425 / ATCC 29141) TaxID=395961 RepID=B8HZ12_CYAP4
MAGLTRRKVLHAETVHPRTLKRYTLIYTFSF